MVTTTRVRIEDYLALPEVGPPWLEYIDGEVVEKPVGSAIRGDLVVQFAFHLSEYRQRFGGRAALSARSRFEDPRDPRFMLPDASFWKAGIRASTGAMATPPTFALEILSDGDTVQDQFERCRYYLGHGVEEAWLVDFDRHTIEVFDAEREGLAFVTGIVRSSSLPGFSISLESLFAGADDEFAPTAPNA